MRHLQRLLFVLPWAVIACGDSTAPTAELVQLEFIDAATGGGCWGETLRADSRAPATTGGSNGAVMANVCDDPPPPEEEGPPPPPPPGSSTEMVAPCPECGERQPNGLEKPQIQENINQRTYCQDGKEFLQQKLNEGKILVYEEEDGDWGHWDSWNARIFISKPRHWKTLPDGRIETDILELADTMIEEAVHALLGHTEYTPEYQRHDDAFKARMAQCKTPPNP